MDPFLHSINRLLMEEGLEDATCVRQDGTDAPYQAILRSFYDIIGEHLPPTSSIPSTTSYESLYDLHQITEEEHVQSCCGKNGVKILTHQMLSTGASRVILPANGNLQSRLLQEERADTRLGLPGRAGHVVCPSSANWTEFSSNRVQGYHAAIKLNDGQLKDTTKVSCWELKDKALNSFFRSCSSTGSNAHFQLPSPYKECSLKLASVELSFEDLKLHEHYAALYVGEPGIPIGPPKHIGDKEKALAVACKHGKSGIKRTACAQEYVDLRDLIEKCGRAVAVGDARVVHELLQDIRQVHGASADGNASQRVAHYFSEALVARMRGTGGHLFRAMLHKQPSAEKVLKSFKTLFEVTPVYTVIHYFANQSILKAAERASRLHIVDYGLAAYGMHWAFLINALADQKGGPPLLVITGIDSPQLGNNPAERLEESGQLLAAHARAYNVPFQYHAIASSKWEDLDSSSFHFHEDEVLVVTCIGSLRHFGDVEILRRIHSLKPQLLVTAPLNAASNSSLFVSRFREALYFYSNVFDMLQTLWVDNTPERLLMERGMHRDILNLLACEGAERVKRPESYKQWEVRIKRAGFEQLEIPPEALSRLRSHLKQHYHKDLFVHENGNKWMLVGWKGRTIVAVSAWKLSHVQ